MFDWEWPEQRPAGNRIHSRFHFQNRLIKKKLSLFMRELTPGEVNYLVYKNEYIKCFTAEV